MAREPPYLPSKDTLRAAAPSTWPASPQLAGCAPCRTHVLCPPPSPLFTRKRVHAPLVGASSVTLTSPGLGSLSANPESSSPLRIISVSSASFRASKKVVVHSCAVVRRARGGTSVGSVRVRRSQAARAGPPAACHPPPPPEDSPPGPRRNGKGALVPPFRLDLEHRGPPRAVISRQRGGVCPRAAPARICAQAFACGSCTHLSARKGQRCQCSSCREEEQRSPACRPAHVCCGWPERLAFAPDQNAS